MWSAPSQDGFSPVTDYVVQFKPQAAGTWNTFDDGKSVSTAAPVKGLIKGTAYVFRVLAVNAVGTGLASTESAAVTVR